MLWLKSLTWWEKQLEELFHFLLEPFTHLTMPFASILVSALTVSCPLAAYLWGLGAVK